MPTEVLHCTDIKKKTMIDLFSLNPSQSMSGNDLFLEIQINIKYYYLYSSINK